jgi:hypothetical protein
MEMLVTSYQWVMYCGFNEKGEPMCAWCGMYRKDMNDPDAHLATHKDDKPE